MQGPGAAHPRHEELLAQREWIRGLARVLAADEATADDLEQETLVAALRSPPPGGGFPRAWLATVMRNFAHRGHRDAGRARRREEAAARPEAGDDAAGVVARAEAHGRVVDAVLALPEPARTAILLRFYDGLPPREVARRTGVPVETARTRLKRALADLRKRLGGERGREGLLGLLVPLLRPEKGIAAGAAGGIAMGAAAKVAFTAGAVALATVGVVAWRVAGTGDGDPAAAPIEPAAPTPPAVPGPPKVSLTMDNRPEPPTAAPAPAPRAASMEKNPGADKERVAALLAREIPVALEEKSIEAALREVARKVDLTPEYASDDLRLHFSVQRLVAISLDSPIPFREAVTLLLQMAGPFGNKGVDFEIRGDRLFLHAAGPPPAPKEAEEEVRKRQAQEDELLRALRARTTTFVFDGNQTLAEALAYLRAQQSLNIVVDTGATERCETLKVKLSLKNSTIKDALDELLRLDPDLLWELRGNVVLVRRK